MIRAPLTDAIVEVFDTLPSQLQDAARYLLDNPEDVALLSMREQARRAGLQPWTMVRLAKRLGFDGYEPLRSLYANAMRQGELGFAGKAGAQLEHQREVGDRALAAEMIKSLSAQIAELGEPERLGTLAAAADRLHAARRIFCLGLRSSHPVVGHFAYVMSFLGEKAVMLDGVSGAGTDAIRLATAGDVLFVASVAPYTRLTVDLSRRAAATGVPVVAVTDSLVSPLVGLADVAVLVPTESPSFFHTMSPAFAIGEILAALIAGKGGEKSLAAIRRTEDQLSQLDIHILPPRARRKA